MKPIIRILLIVLLLVLYSCKSIALYDTSTDYDFKFDLYSQVKMYFRANLKYPTVNELWNYCAAKTMIHFYMPPYQSHQMIKMCHH